MAARQFPSPTRAQCNPRSFPRHSLSFSHRSPSFPRGHADQGGRPGAGSAAALPRCVSTRPGGGDGGSRGGAAGWSILESSGPGVYVGGGAARGGVDETPWALLTYRVCSRSFYGGLEALCLHTKICPPAPAAAAQPPALLPQQDREKTPSMAWTRTRPHEPAWVARAAHVPTVVEVLRPLFLWLREEDLGMPCFAKFVRGAEKIVSMSADEPALYRAAVYVKIVVAAASSSIPQVKPKVPAVPTYPVLNSAVLPAGPAAISDPHAAAAATMAIAPAPGAAAATLPPAAPSVPVAEAPMAFAAPLAAPPAFGRGSAGAGAGAGVINGGYACKTCGEKFKSGQALGGHVTALHRRATPSLAGVPDANITSLAMRKRPAMEAASPGNGKRRCIRLFGVDILVEAPEE